MENQLFKKEYVTVTNDKFNSKTEFFKFLTDILIKNKVINLKDKDKVINEYLNREKQGSTGFENGFAIPHCRSEFALKPSLIAVKLTIPTNWESMDKKPTDKLFCIIVPSNNGASNLHMEILSNIAVGIMDKNLTSVLNDSVGQDEIYNAIDKFVFKKNEPTIAKASDGPDKNDSEDIKYKKRILVVSACTYGLAHTYMAEKKAMDYGKEHDYYVKVETHGSRGDLNMLTDEDMKNADGIIIAVDKPMDLDRIKNKNIVHVRTIDLIKNPEICFEKAIDPKKNKLSKKEEIKNLFAITAYQKLFFGSSRGWNYVGWASMVVGVLVYIISVSPSFYPKEINSMLLIVSMAALLAPCLFSAYVGYVIMKKSNSVFFTTLFITTGLSFFQKFKNFNFENFTLNEWTAHSSIGIIGAICIMICILAVHWVMKTTNDKLPKKLITKDCFVWIIEIIINFLILVIFYKWIIDPMSVANNAIYSWWNKMDDKYWWFRFIFAFVFFELMILDLGGPANKWALVFSAILFFDSFAWNPTQPFLTPFTATCLAVPVPCLGLGIRGFLLQKILSEDEKKKSWNAFKAHFKGISEPALFALDDYHWRGYLANIITSLVAAILIAIFHLEFWGGFNNLYGIIFSFSRTEIVPFGNIAFVIVICGSVATSALANMILLNPIKK